MIKFLIGLVFLVSVAQAEVVECEPYGDDIGWEEVCDTDTMEQEDEAVEGDVQPCGAEDM